MTAVTHMGVQRVHDKELRIFSKAEFEARVRNGAKWTVIDHTIVDLEELMALDGPCVHKGGVEVLRIGIGEDTTSMFTGVHANLQNIASLHCNGSSVIEHIRAKIASNVVGVLDTLQGQPPLCCPEHRFWTESPPKPMYNDEVPSSLKAQEIDASILIAAAVEGLTPGSVKWRAFWAVLGSLVADAAAQPTHWNYKISYFHDELRKRGHWEAPEFMKPSMNDFYKVPIGSYSCYGDQSFVVLESLLARQKVDPLDIKNRFVKKFGSHGEYGPLDQQRELLPISGPWRHGSLTQFLNNVARGCDWPHCGSDDSSADCFVKAVPVVALYAGSSDLLDRVEEVVAVTQNNPLAISAGRAFARILEAILLGTAPSSAVAEAIQAFGTQQPSLEEWEKTVGSMRRAAELSQLNMSEAAGASSGGRFEVWNIA